MKAENLNIKRARNSDSESIKKFVIFQNNLVLWEKIAYYGIESKIPTNSFENISVIFEDNVIDTSSTELNLKEEITVNSNKPEMSIKVYERLKEDFKIIKISSKSTENPFKYKFKKAVKITNDDN